MGRPKRLYPLGKYRLRTPKVIDKEKAYPIELEYTWNRQIIRKTTNVFVKVADWNQNGNQGRGEIRVSYGSEFKRLNQLLLSRVERIDSQLAEYNEKHPNQITADVISGFLSDKPLSRRDQGKDFVEFTLERLSSDYSRNRIGRSRYENGRSCMNIFQTFLRATKQATCGNDSIYVGDVTPELLDSYIAWRREVKQNTDATINHSLTPILKACAYACEMNIMEPAINARIQDMRIITKTSLSEEESEFDGKSLNKEQMQALMEYYKTCQEPRRKEFLEMFFFAFHACGLRVVDVMTLQWGHVNFEKKEMLGGKNLAGAHFVLRNDQGEVVEEWTSTDVVKTIEKLIPGQYTLSEVQAPSGYVLNQASPTFEVEKTGDVQVVTMFNALEVKVPNTSKNSLLYLFIGTIIIMTGLGIFGYTYYKKKV